MKKLIGTLLAVLLIVLVFWLGQKFGSKNVNQQILSNNLIVQEIAELSSLEVQGVASIKRSNVNQGNDWSDNMKKTFLENTIWVSVPYLAKYGVDIDKNNFSVKVSDKKITVNLPAPKLLSYELKVDKMETATRKGWLLFQDDDTYTDVQKKLYQSSRGQLEKNTTYIEQSKQKIRKIITQYYQPFLKDHTLEIHFDGDSSIPALP
ncbi:DUF4230 domain-containing protein [Chitinophaga pendula]|uniref:DUF4230 domain-containing protein n=1 Tax=Chitinophaga TaxID=79328 RepID=UPI000BB03BB9|nr:MULTISPECIES: DUF4230 domain-containing protein [Chitinophaga]ASZ11792.1 hypothetical protein CK934_12905 [Chitinophaga sp. MD30]UCJ05188.1 DUF4230 domain-containing protein [Chitinophaga pendula]